MVISSLPTIMVYVPFRLFVSEIFQRDGSSCIPFCYGMKTLVNFLVVAASSIHSHLYAY